MITVSYGWEIGEAVNHFSFICQGDVLYIGPLTLAEPSGPGDMLAVQPLGCLLYSQVSSVFCIKEVEIASSPPQPPLNKIPFSRRNILEMLQGTLLIRGGTLLDLGPFHKIINTPLT